MANKLTCIVTGRVLLATDDYYARKIEKAGSAEQLERSYICREAKNLIKQGTSVDRARDILNVKDTNLPDVPQDVLDCVRATDRVHFRRFNNIKNINSMINTTTDPQIKDFIKNIRSKKK